MLINSKLFEKIIISFSKKLNTKSLNTICGERKPINLCKLI